MAENERTIVPGTWSDVFAGLDTQGLGRLRVQIVGEDGEPISEALPLIVADQSATAASIKASNEQYQALKDISDQIDRLIFIVEGAIS